MTTVEQPSGPSAAREPRRDSVPAALEDERDFLLRSIADLDSEHATGDLDDARHRELRDGYVVQAATVLRAIEQVGDAERGTQVLVPRRGRAVALMGGGLAALAVAAGVLLGSVGDRQPGQTITGNAQSEPVSLAELARAAAERPDDAEAQLQYAHALLEARRAADALRAFDAAARLDPTDPVPKAYAGWIVFLAGLPDEALVRLDSAIASDPSYPDAHFFRGMVLLRGRNDAVGGLRELREFVRLAPPGPERDEARRLVEELETDAAAAVG